MKKSANSKKQKTPNSKTSPERSHAEKLVAWYRKARRDLPWRRSRDPYRIWISEVMLQQTTVAAVVPYFERFIGIFPDVQTLAEAPLESVLENWAGLGYYSRARNLHRSAKILAENGFPKTAEELLKLPGFGPYTARAVSSLAFDEATGVLDGNVIRVLSRLYGLNVEWWKPKGRDHLQDLADRLANQGQAPADLNQGLMELGATICTPTSPACLLCPWTTTCAAKAIGSPGNFPLKRPRRVREIWHWLPRLIEKNSAVLVQKNTYAPFLKGHWILPGKVERLKSAPETFDYRGSVTHHDIFVSVSVAKGGAKAERTADAKWVKLKDLRKEIPASLIRKAIETGIHAQ